MPICDCFITIPLILKSLYSEMNLPIGTQIIVEYVICIFAKVNYIPNSSENQYHQISDGDALYTNPESDSKKHQAEMRIIVPNCL